MPTPNIVYICSDQHSFRFTGYAGHPLVQSPPYGLPLPNEGPSSARPTAAALFASQEGLA